MIKKNIMKKAVSALVAISALSLSIIAGAVDIATNFSDGTLPSDVVLADRTAAINTDANGYHFENGVAGRAAADKSLVVDLALENEEADNNLADSLQFGTADVLSDENQNRTVEFSVMFEGDYDGGEVFQSITRADGVRRTGRFIDFRSDGKILALNENDGMTVVGTYNKGEWVSVAITWNLDGSYKLWINDLFAYYCSTIQGSGNITTWHWMRIGTYTAQNTTGSTKNIRFAVDDFKAYDAEYRKAEHRNGIIYDQADDYALINTSKTIVMPAGDTLAKLETGLGVSNASVMVYTDSTFGTRITASDAVIPDGAKVVVQATNNIRIDTWTVSTNSALKEIAYFDFESGASPVSLADRNPLYESATVTGGGYGKTNNAYKVTASNVPANVSTVGRISLIDSLSTTIGSGNDIASGVHAVEKNLMTFEFSLLADGDFSNVRLEGRDAYFNSRENRDELGSAVYFRIYPDGRFTYTDNEGTNRTSAVEFNKGEWNRVAMTINPEDFTMTLYINGTEIISNKRLGGLTDRNWIVFKGFNWLSPRMNISADPDADSARNAVMAVDDIEVYYGAYSSDSVDVAQLESTNLRQIGKELYLDDDRTVASFIAGSDFGTAGYAIWDDTYSSTLGGSGTLIDGYHVVLTSPSGNTYNYYTIAPELKIYVNGVEDAEIVDNSTLKAEYTSERSGRVIILAIYDADGRLVQAVCGNTVPYEVSYNVGDGTGISAMAMAWNSLDDAKPLLPARIFTNQN